MKKLEYKAEEVKTEEDGSKVYVYRYPSPLKRKDKDGNKKVAYCTIVCHHNPSNARLERVAKKHSMIRSLYETNPDLKPGQLYKLYIDKCNEEGISEDDQYARNHFYLVLKRIKNSTDEKS